MDDLSGKTLKGYELIERIGTGGFGAVYRARQTTVGREVAIKIILPGFASKPDFIRRFETEAHLIANIEHLHIVPLYDFWRDPDGAYLVMRYLRGGSIRDALQHGPYDLDAAALMLDQIASSLSASHRSHVIHRDVKPSNILLDEDGNAYLSDFGIAKNLQDVSGYLTAAEQIVGSLDYLSPEQARSEPVTSRTDIYSLGVTLFEAITGKHPFHDFSSVERLYKHINDPLPDIENLDDDVRESINIVIQKATAKNPANRYEDALTMAAEFRQAAALARLRPAAGVLEQLTPREQDILKLLMEGLSNAEIAERLFITVSTVKWYNQQLYSKLGVRSRVQAVNRAREMNLFSLPAMTDDEPGSDDQADISYYLPEPENPYKGLRAFRAADRHDFFGREQLVERLQKRMDEREQYSNFLAIVGPSGSGKSSLVKAGLMPALTNGGLPGSEKWFHVGMLPGTHPLDELEVALIKVAAEQGANLNEQLRRDARGLIRVANMILPDDDSKLILVIDQFEEIFTLVEDEKERQHFLNLIYQAATDERSRVCIIITLRADYYDRPLQYPDFGKMLRERMETILPLSAKDLERAIVGPASRVKVTFEEGLVANIVAEMTYQASALPLLQYALTELFEKRKGRVLTHQAYQEIGGAVGALAKRADEIFLELNGKGQELTRQLFLRLVTIGDGAEDSRRRVTRSELLSLADSHELIDEIIDSFAAYRLLSLDHDPATRRPTVEVAHEAILREWERLRQWLHENRNEIRRQRQLTRMAGEWLKSGRDNSFLLHGTRLQQFEQWSQDTELAMTGLEQEFLSASLEERQLQAELTAQRKAHEKQLEKQAQTVLRILVVVFAIATIATGGMAVFAFQQRSEAEQRAAELQANNLLLHAREALQADRQELAVALAMAGTEGEFTPELAENILLDLATSPGVVRLFEGHTSAISDIELGHGDPPTTLFSATDPEQGSSDPEYSIRQWNLMTGEEIRRFDGHTAGISDIALSPNGEHLLSASSDGRFILWRVDTGEIIREFTDLAEPIRVEFADSRGELALFYSIETEENPQTLSGIRGRITDSSLLLRDLRTGEIRQRFADDDPETVIRAYIYQMETGRLVTEHGISSFDRFLNDRFLNQSQTANLWQVSSGELIQEIELTGNYAVGNPMLFREGGLRFDIQDDLLTFVTTAHVLPFNQECIPTIYLWDLAERSVETFVGEPILSTDPLFECVTTRIVESEAGQTNLLINHNSAFPKPAYLLDLRTQQTIRELETFGIVVFSRDRNHAILGNNDHIALYETDTWREIFRAALDVYPVSLNGVVLWALDNRVEVIVTGADGSIRHWRVNDFSPAGEQSVQISSNLPSLTAEYSPDGRTILIGGGIPSTDNPTPNELFLIEAQNGDRIREYEGHQATIFDASFTPNGEKIVSVGVDNRLIIWDVESGDILQQIQNDVSTPIYAVTVSPDGQLAYAAIGNVWCDACAVTNEIVVVDVSTGTIQELVDLPQIDETIHVWAIDVSADGRALALSTNPMNSSEPGNGVYILDSDSFEIVQQIPQPDDFESEGIAFSPDGRILAVADTERGVTLWDVASGEAVQTLISDIDTPYHLVRFSPDGRLIAASRGDFGEGETEEQGITVWDVATGKEISFLRGHSLFVRGFDFSPDGTQIVSTSGDRSIIIRDIETKSVREWLLENRYVPEFTCEQRVQFNIEPLCDAEQ